MSIGTSRLMAGTDAGAMIGASSDSGPSPSNSATPDPGSSTICSEVIENSAATPAGRSAEGSAKLTSTWKLQTSATWTDGFSGAVQVDWSAGAPTDTLCTAAGANLRASMAARADADGHAT